MEDPPKHWSLGHFPKDGKMVLLNPIWMFAGDYESFILLEYPVKNVVLIETNGENFISELVEKLAMNSTEIKNQANGCYQSKEF